MKIKSGKHKEGSVCTWYKVANASLRVWPVSVIKVNNSTLILNDTDLSGKPVQKMVQKISKYAHYFEKESDAKSYAIAMAESRVEEAEADLKWKQDLLHRLIEEYGRSNHGK